MEHSDLTNHLKLAAIDLDGTLLGPKQEISPENFHAVQRLQAAGLHVLLASGRHFLNIRRFADKLPGVEWIVSCQGGETASVDRSIVLGRDFLTPTLSKQILDMGQARGFAQAYYAVEEVYTAAREGNSELERYAALAGRAAQQMNAAELVKLPAFKIIWMGSAEAIDAAIVQGVFAPGFQMVRTHDWMVEFMPIEVSKATGLQRLVDRIGIKPSQTIVFGDGDNDVPMFEWAGTSYAMAHGWPAALQSATHITEPGPIETAFARGVEHAFRDGALR